MFSGAHWKSNFYRVSTQTIRNFTIFGQANWKSNFLGVSAQAKRDLQSQKISLKRLSPGLTQVMYHMKLGWVQVLSLRQPCSEPWDLLYSKLWNFTYFQPLTAYSIDPLLDNPQAESPAKMTANLVIIFS